MDMPYGMDLAGTPCDTSPMHFTGKQRDSESGLDYFGARFNASSLGRFMTPDWSANLEPVPRADYENPQTLNLYGYLANNPTSRIDVDGHAGQKPLPGCSTCTYRADPNNPNDMPNLHVFKGGNNAGKLP